MLLRELKENNRLFFSERNKKFFNDRQYWVKHSKKTGEPYLVRSTYAWSDMFGNERVLHYRINPIADGFKIKPLVEDILYSIKEVDNWLENN